MHKSPFNIVHEQQNANFSDYNGWSLPSDFGDGASESKALSESCAVVDLCSFGRIQIAGPAAKETINNLFSIEKGVIAQECWVWAKPVGYEAETLCRIFRLHSNYTLLTQPEHKESLCQWITTHAEEGVAVSDVTSKTAMLGLYGPQAFHSMRGVLPFEIDHLDTGEVEKMTFMMLSFTLLRGSWLNSEGLELICPAAAGPLAAGAVAKYRHKHNITPAGMDSLQAAMQTMASPL